MLEKRLHVPMVDRTPEEPPPVVVAVVGPPGVDNLLDFADGLGWKDYTYQKSGKEIYETFAVTGHWADNRCVRLICSIRKSDR